MGRIGHACYLMGEGGRCGGREETGAEGFREREERKDDQGRWRRLLLFSLGPGAFSAPLAADSSLI